MTTYLVAAELLRVAHSPDRAVTILAEEETAILGHRDPDRASPYAPVRRNKTGDEVFEFTERLAAGMIERHTHDFVTCALCPVPRTMERGENVASVFSWKLIADVKAKIQTCAMGL